MKYLNVFSVIIGLVLLTNPAFADKKLAKREMKVDQELRSYYIRYPETLDSQSRFPLVIVLHGGGRRDGDETAEMTGFADMADKENFIAVFPNGIKSKWHDGRLPKKEKKVAEYKELEKNDIAFLTGLIDYLVKYEQVDEDRVYLTGLSNGGMMTIRMACDASKKFAAVAPVIAGMPVDIVNGCNPKTQLPFLLMNGTEDPLVPWHGGQVHGIFKDRGRVLSGEETFNFWLTKNQCNRKPVLTETLANKDTKDKSVINHRVYSCANNVDMQFYIVIGGGHTMPGSDIPNLKRILGQKNMDTNGAELIWQFFSKHVRPNQNTTSK